MSWPISVLAGYLIGADVHVFGLLAAVFVLITLFKNS